MNLNIYSSVTLDELFDSFRDLAERTDAKTFNKEAFKIIEELLYRSRQLDGEKDLSLKIQKILHQDE